MTKATPRPPKALATTPTLPPLVIALFRLAEPNLNGIPKGFIEAYAAMPALLAHAMQSNDEPATHRLINHISGYAAAIATADANPDIDKTPPTTYEETHDPARIIAILNRINGDYPTALTAPVSTAGFWVGMAFASYVLTNGGGR